MTVATPNPLRTDIDGIGAAPTPAALAVGMPYPDRLLSADEAAELLGVSAYTVRQWARERRIPHVPLGPKLKRFRLSSLQQWMADQERAAR